MKLRRASAALPALLLVMLLSSCSFLSTLPHPSEDAATTAVALRHIVDAVNSHDSAALEQLFSPRARKNATNLAAGLKYFQSVFPAGLKDNSQSGSGCASSGDSYAEESSCDYIVKVDGKEYDVFFDDVTVDIAHPDAVGIYAMGAEPYVAYQYSASGIPDAFGVWGSQFDLNDADLVTGTPGVYTPGIAASVLAPTPAVEMRHFANELKDHDLAELKSLFSPLARENAPNLDNELKYLLFTIPSDHITWKSEGQADCGAESSWSTTAYVEVCPSYRVSANGKKYDLVFVEFRVDRSVAADVGIYALSFTVHSGTAPALSKQLSTWAEIFQPDSDGNISPTPGVYLTEN